VISSNIMPSFIASFSQAPDYARCNMSAKQSTVAKLPISLGDVGFALAFGVRPDCPNTGTAATQGAVSAVLLQN
jgi:hypothetical protein